ncbi:MAG: outer membrane protein assembly factor BamD [Alphaproteobacteria bacterium]|nr:outer membrane protein assembly factor BamD [Alphaproteobacteria bacterium]
MRYLGKIDLFGSASFLMMRLGFFRGSAGLLLFCTAFFVSGCLSSGVKSGRESDAEAFRHLPASVLFAEAEEFLAQEDFDDAADAFSDIEAQYPYSSLGRRALLLSAEAYYRGHDYVRASSSALRYVELYPKSNELDHAYYLIGVSSYAQILGATRDQSATRKALLAFQQLESRYSGSVYAENARKYIYSLRNRLASSEISIAFHYLQRGDYVAALNRYKTVIKLYGDTEQAPEALFRMAEIYLALGIISEAQSSVSVLSWRFESSEWYKRGEDLLEEHGLKPYYDEKSWISEIFSGP